MISVLEFILAARFEHGYGVLVALLAYALALAGLIAILNSNFFAKWHHKWRLLVWIPNIFLFLYLIVLISVRLAAPDHLVSSFPAACAKTTNCCRLTRDNTTSMFTPSCAVAAGFTVLQIRKRKGLRSPCSPPLPMASSPWLRAGCLASSTQDTCAGRSVLPPQFFDLFLIDSSVQQFPVPDTLRLTRVRFPGRLLRELHVC